MPARCAPVHHFAASGGVLVLLERPALTPALTEIRLWVLSDYLANSCYPTTLSCESRLCRLVAVQFTPTGALPVGVPHG